MPPTDRRRPSPKSRSLGRWTRSCGIALLRSLFDFHYLWEVYTPQHKRRWGYYVLPILYGDRFVGRIEPRFDRAAGTLRVLGLWWEDGFDPSATEGFVAAMRRALAAYMRFGGVRTIAWAPHLGGARRLIGASPRHWRTSDIDRH